MTAKNRRILFFIVFALMAVTWQTPLLAPLKILVVFLHELSHALATWATGGSVAEFVVSAYQSGHVTSIGGSRFITLSAGYLGSLLFGLLFYTVSTKAVATDLTLGILAALMLFVSLFFPGSIYTAVFGVSAAVAIIALQKYAKRQVKQLVLLVVATASMIYVPIDIYQDTILHSGALSDARMLAREFGGTTVLWGIIWFAISLYFIYLTLRNNR